MFETFCERFMIPIIKKVLSCSILIIGIVSFSSLAKSESNPTVKVGVLKFGTINWEMDTIKRLGLDVQFGYHLDVVPLASKNAAAVALQSRAVDIIMTDAFWVAKQQSQHKDYVLFPTTILSGGIYSKHPEIKDVDTWLRYAPELGIAGGNVDKNWLLTQAYLRHQNIDINRIKPTFAAPPLLNRMLLKEQISSGINFWHYTARLKAAGFTPVITTQDMLMALGIATDVPLLGWAFDAQWAAAHQAKVTAFIRSSQSAKHVLRTQPAIWDALSPLTKAENDAVFSMLVQDYQATLLQAFDTSHIKNFDRLLAVFAPALDLKRVSATDVFWQPSQSIWQTPATPP